MQVVDRYRLKLKIDEALRQYKASAVSWETSFSNLVIRKYDHPYSADRSVIYECFIVDETDWQEHRIEIERDLCYVAIAQLVGSTPEICQQGVLKVCEFYTHFSPEECAPSLYKYLLAGPAEDSRAIVLQFKAAIEGRKLEYAIAKASSEETKGDPNCEQCHGQGCSECNDEIWYAGENALEQFRRDRNIDFARQAFDVGW